MDKEGPSLWGPYRKAPKYDTGWNPLRRERKERKLLLVNTEVGEVLEHPLTGDMPDYLFGIRELKHPLREVGKGGLEWRISKMSNIKKGFDEDLTINIDPYHFGEYEDRYIKGGNIQQENEEIS